MANTRFNTTTKAKTPSSGSSEQLPQILKYPPLLSFGEKVRDIYCYIIRHYGRDGLAVLIYRQPRADQVVIMCGDWNGNKIDLVGSKPSPLTVFANDFATKEAFKFYELMRLIKIDQAQFFFAIVNNNPFLVDVQVSLNKMASPGMVNDVFGRIFPIQQVLKTEIIDERAIEHIQKGSGSYEGDLILKPSRFRMHEDAGQYQPLYVELIR